MAGDNLCGGSNPIKTITSGVARDNSIHQDRVAGPSNAGPSNARESFRTPLIPPVVGNNGHHPLGNAPPPMVTPGVLAVTGPRVPAAPSVPAVSTPVVPAANATGVLAANGTMADVPENDGMVVPPYVAADPAWNFKAFPPIVADMMQKLNAPPVAPGLDPTQVRPNGLLKTSMTPVTGGFWRPRLVNDPGRFIGSGTPPAGANLGPYANLDGGPGKIHFELVGPDGKVDPINGPTVTVKLPDSDIHAWGPAWAHDFMAGTRAARTAAANRNYAALAAHHEMLRVPANPELLDDMTAEAEYRMIDPAYMHVGPEFTRAEVRQRARYHTEFEDEMAAWMEAHGPEAERLAVLEDQEVMNNLFDIAEAQDIREREDRQVANLEAMVAAGHQARGESPPTPRTAAADRARFREFVQGNAANPLDDFDRRLRRAATQLVDAVADDTSERFASSQFIRQMRMIAEGRVVLRDNNLVDLTESDRDNDSDINQATPASSSQADAQRPEHPASDEP